MQDSLPPTITGKVSSGYHVDIFRSSDGTYAWSLLDEFGQVAITGLSSSIEEAFRVARGYAYAS